MTYTFLKAQGHEIGKSRCELDKLDEARGLLAKARARSCCPSIISSPPHPTPRRRRRSSRAPTSPTAGSAWTSAQDDRPLRR